MKRRLLINSKLSSTRKRLFREGKLCAWNKGLKGVIHLSEETKRKSASVHLGRKRSKITRYRISEALKGHTCSEETRTKLSLAHKGMHPSFETLRKQSIARRGKKRSIETRRKISRALKEHPCYRAPERSLKISLSRLGKSCMINKHRELYNGIYFRSSWEVIFAKWLDRNNYLWKYEPKRFFFKNYNFSYLPDFYVTNLASYVEVKGRYRPIDDLKIIAFKEEYPDEKLFVVDQNIINFYKEIK